MRPSRRAGSREARATTLPSAFSSTASQRGRKAWRRRRKRRERRRWWWRPLASVRWRRRWWRQWTGRLGPEQLEQPLAEGWPKTGSGLLSLAGSRACNCPSRTSPPPWPTRSVSRSGLAWPLLPWPRPLQDGFDSFPKLPGLRSSPHDPSHRWEDWLPFPQVSPRVAPRSLPHNLQDLLLHRVTHLCALPPPTFRLRDAAPLEFSRNLGATAQCAPLPHLEFSGPAPCTEGRGSRTRESVVAVFSCPLCNVILVVCLPSPLNLWGHPRTVPFVPVSWKASGGLNFWLMRLLLESVNKPAPARSRSLRDFPPALWLLVERFAYGLALKRFSFYFPMSFTF